MLCLAFFSTHLVCLSSGSVRCLAFKPDNPNILVSCSSDATIKMWGLTSGSCVSTVTCDRYGKTPSVVRLSCMWSLYCKMLQYS